ncbi:MAG: DUF4375 domain-containing protein [Clostridia bacterium]|nr:DUF4375 domain-containing protein [Clostridia bacterium]
MKTPDINKIWDLWAEGKAKTPYAELMTYQGEINNGGHSQFFLNVSNSGDLPQTVEVLLGILPEPLKSNLQRAYDSYLSTKDSDEEDDELLDECDNVFYDNEEKINSLLDEYALSLEPETEGADTKEAKVNSEKKYFMHTTSNIASFFAIPILLVVFGYLMLKNAYNDTMRIVGVAALFVIFAFSTWMFLFGFRIFDYLVFTEETVERRSFFAKPLKCSYSELFVCLGTYTSALEEKPRLIFTPKVTGSAVTHIDTSKFGNITPVNRLGVIYCAPDTELVEFLRTREGLSWVE